MTLATKFALAIAEVIRNHPEELCQDDVVSLLLGMGSSYGRSRLGVEKTLILLTAQMMVVTDNDVQKVQDAVDRMKAAVSLQQVLSKIGKLRS